MTWTLTRIDVAHVDGRVWFDRIALWPVAGARLTSFVSDHESTIAVGTTVTWTATATGTVQPLEYRFERRDDLGNWSIVQPYGMQPSYAWTPTAADVGTNAVRVSVRNGGSTADFEDTATLLVRVVDGGEEGFRLHGAQERFAWWKRWFEPRVPVSLGVDHGTIATTSDLPARRHSLYTPELQLLAETEITTAPSPAIAYEYIWFAGQPLAQIASATGAISWYFNDHLGTPILQTDSEAGVAWRVEYEPYGTVFFVVTGADKHQPLRFPGQESDARGELSYNIFRWYRPGWGRYTQADPLGLIPGPNLVAYARQNPLRYTDLLGLASKKYNPFELPDVPPMPGPFPDTDCCSAGAIADAMASAQKQINDMMSGGVPTGTIVAATMVAYYCHQGTCYPVPSDPSLFTFGHNYDKDKCVNYCVNFHEWIHFSDTRTWGETWTATQREIFHELPAYVGELACLTQMKGSAGKP